MKKKTTYTTSKAFKNKSFVKFVIRREANRLKQEDGWGGSNLSGWLETIAENEIEGCCVSPAIAKAYLEWEGSLDCHLRDTNPFIDKACEYVEEHDDELYTELAIEFMGCLGEDLSETIEDAAETLSAWTRIDIRDHSEEWTEYLKDACDGYNFSEAV